MNKPELIAAVVQQTGMAKKDAERMVCATFDIIAAQMAAGEKVQISGFGIFETKHRQARMGRHPVTKEPMQIPAAKIPVFKPGKALKESVEK